MRRDLLELVTLAVGAVITGLDLVLHLAILYTQLRTKLLLWRAINKAELRWALVKFGVPRALRRELVEEYDETLSMVKLPGLSDAFRGRLSPWGVHRRPGTKRARRAS